MVQDSTVPWIQKSLTRRYPKNSSEIPIIVASWYFWKEKNRTGRNLPNKRKELKWLYTATSSSEILIIVAS